MTEATVHCRWTFKLVLNKVQERHASHQDTNKDYVLFIKTSSKNTEAYFSVKFVQNILDREKKLGRHDGRITINQKHDNSYKIKLQLKQIINY